MCCIIYRIKDAKEISKEYIEKIVKKNPHGWGISYIGDDGALIVEKKMNMDLAYDKIREIEKQNKEFLFHARWATHGEKNEENCHPFHIHNGVMFHNGKIKLWDWKSKMSDSWHFSFKVTKLLKKKRKSLNDIIEKSFKSLVGESRLAFMMQNGEVHRFGKWHELDGCFYSKLDWKYYSSSSSIDYDYGYGYGWNSVNRNNSNKSVSQDKSVSTKYDSWHQLNSRNTHNSNTASPYLRVRGKLGMGGKVTDQDIENLDVESIQLIMQTYPDQMADYMYNLLSEEI